MRKGPEIVIIGGNVIGSSIAFFLAASDLFNGSITVIEKDTFDRSKLSARAWADIRQQFALPENIRMSQYAEEFLGDLTKHLTIDGSPVHVGYVPCASFFLFEERQLSLLYGYNSIQKGEAVNVAMLDPEDISRGFPWLNISGLAGGSLGLSGEGWIEGHRLNQAFRRKAISLGVTFLKTEATSLEVRKHKVTNVRLTEGRTIPCDYVINAAGPEAATVAKWAGIELNVRRRKRTAFSFSCQTQFEECPQVFDPSGVWFRSDGQRFITSCQAEPDDDPERTDPEIDYSLFEEHIWPVLAHRVADFKFAQLERADATMDAYTLLDGNPIIGPHPDIRNFFFATGFSGRDVQHAPATGRALSEIILSGRYETLDLSRFSYERMVTGEALSEHTVI